MRRMWSSRKSKPSKSWLPQRSQLITSSSRLIKSYWDFQMIEILEPINWQGRNSKSKNKRQTLKLWRLSMKLPRNSFLCIRSDSTSKRSYQDLTCKHLIVHIWRMQRLMMICTVVELRWPACPRMETQMVGTLIASWRKMCEKALKSIRTRSGRKIRAQAACHIVLTSILIHLCRHS